MQRGITILVLLLAMGLTACVDESDYIEVANNPTYLHQSMLKLTEVIVHDIFSPPVASRIYVYPSIAAYEVMASSNDDFITLAGQVHDLAAVPKPETGKIYSYPLAAVYAFLETSKALIFSEPKLQEFENELLAKMKAEGVPQGIYDRSIAYGKKVSDHILAWADGDNYKQTRTFPKYSITEDTTKWQPTPPDYMEGIEPHWREIRTFIIDSAQQFVPMEPTEFSTDPSSKFHKEAMVVYDAVAHRTPEFIAVAEFWDCNPFVSHHKGHVMFATKKITPGGHWIGITAQASRQVKADFDHTIEAYARVSITLADAFISCWDEKYRSNLIRPETYINKYVDPDWLPTLQTPPFPEHTSGHSVISSAAGEVLTDLLGDNFAFADSVELEYGLPVRSFKSFREAYAEAAISRLYGGIHYMPAINYGVEQGKKVGAFIIDNLETSKN
jgi:hypothetical protein